MHKSRSFFLLAFFLILCGKVFSQSFSVYETKGDSCYAILNYSMAVENYSKAITNAERDDEQLARLFNKKAEVENQMKQYQNAIDDGSMAIKYNPKSEKGYTNRGQAYWYIDKYQQAIDDFTVALGFSNYNDDKSFLFVDRASCERSLKQYEKAVSDATVARELAPTRSLPLQSRALTYQLTGKYELALNDLDSAIQLDGQYKSGLAYSYTTRSTIKARLMKNQEAIDDCTTALSIDPTYIFAYSHRATRYDSNGDFQLAISDFSQYITSPEIGRRSLISAYIGKAASEYFLMQYDAAIQDDKRALSLDSNNYNAFCNMGRVSLKLKQQKIANQYFVKAIQLDSLKTGSGYIFSLFFSGEQAEALEKMKERLSNPKTSYDAILNNYDLACLLSLMNKPKDAMIYLKKATDAGYSKKYAFYDPDLDNIKNETDFKNLIGPF